MIWIEKNTITVFENNNATIVVNGGYFLTDNNPSEHVGYCM